MSATFGLDQKRLSCHWLLTQMPFKSRQAIWKWKITTLCCGVWLSCRSKCETFMASWFMAGLLDLHRMPEIDFNWMENAGETYVLVSDITAVVYSSVVPIPHIFVHFNICVLTSVLALHVWLLWPLNTYIPKWWWSIQSSISTNRLDGVIISAYCLVLMLCIQL